MVSQKDILHTGIDMIFDKSKKPLMALAEKIALGKNYHKINRTKKLISRLRETWREKL